MKKFVCREDYPVVQTEAGELRGYEWDGTVTMEVQGREWLINELLKGLNRNQFITIDWIDTEEILLEDEKKFWVRDGYM